MKGKLKLLFFIEEIGTAIPIRSYIALLLLERNFPITICAYIAGLPDTESLMSIVAQIAHVKAIMTNVKQEPVIDNIAPNSLRERFIEYISNQNG